MIRLQVLALSLGFAVALGIATSLVIEELHHQTAALQQIAASLQGKPPVQVTAVVDLGAGTKQTLEDALRPETKGRKK